MLRPIIVTLNYIRAIYALGEPNMPRNKIKAKRLDSVRIVLPKGVHYDLLKLGADLHNAPSLSIFILNAAMTYTTNYVKEKEYEIRERQAEADADLRLRDSSGDAPGESDSTERSDNGVGGGPGTVPSTGDDGDGPES